MKAMIFAAGLGTRLRPLTNNCPKALVYLGNQTLLERCIHLLAMQGVRTIVINIHHFGEQVIDFVKNHGSFGLDIRFSDERSELLDTGGGLLKAASLLGGTEPIIVINVDIFTNIDLKKMMQAQLQSKALATLAVRNRDSSRKLLFDKDGQLSAWKNLKTGEVKVAREAADSIPWAFSGIQIISPQWFELVNRTGKFSIIDAYLDLAVAQKVLAYPHDADLWADLGTLKALEKAIENI